MAEHTKFTVVKLQLETITFDQTSLHVDSESRINQLNVVDMRVLADAAVDRIYYFGKDISVRVGYSNDNNVLHISNLPLSSYAALFDSKRLLLPIDITIYSMLCDIEQLKMTYRFTSAFTFRLIIQ